MNSAGRTSPARARYQRASASNATIRPSRGSTIGSKTTPISSRSSARWSSTVELVPAADLRVHLRLVVREAVLAALLRRVHRDVGVPEQLVAASPRTRPARCRCSSRRRVSRPPSVIGSRIARAAFCATTSAPLLAGRLEQDGELVAAEPRRGVRRHARARCTRRRDLDEHLVADRVAERVVDRLEVVEVEEQHRRRAPLPCASAVSTRSVKSARFGRPVRMSWKAWWRSRSFRSVTSASERSRRPFSSITLAWPTNVSSSRRSSGVERSRRRPSGRRRRAARRRRPRRGARRRSRRGSPRRRGSRRARAAGGRRKDDASRPRPRAARAHARRRIERLGGGRHPPERPSTLRRPCSAPSGRGQKSAAPRMGFRICQRGMTFQGRSVVFFLCSDHAKLRPITGEQRNSTYQLCNNCSRHDRILPGRA